MSMRFTMFSWAATRQCKSTSRRAFGTSRKICVYARVGDMRQCTQHACSTMYVYVLYHGRYKVQVHVHVACTNEQNGYLKGIWDCMTCTFVTYTHCNFLEVTTCIRGPTCIYTLYTHGHSLYFQPQTSTINHPLHSPYGVHTWPSVFCCMHM